MKAQEIINWLERFIDVWERDEKETHHNVLCDIYTRFCAFNGLPLWSAEDNVYHLRQR